MPLLVELPVARGKDRKARFDYVSVRLGASEYEVPDRFDLVYRPERDEPGWRMSCVVLDGVPQCRSLTVEATDGGREIRAADVRNLAVEDMLTLATNNVASRRDVDEHGNVTLSRDLSGLEEGRRAVHGARRAARRKISPDVLRDVAEVYRQNIGDRPTEAVRRHLGVVERTARLYVKRAREHTDPTTGRPFLGAATKGKAGER